MSGIALDRIGTFRCRLVEKGIGKTKEKGYPQLVGKVMMTEIYDEAQKEWFPIEDWNMEANFYSCLYGVKKGDTAPSPTLGHEQAMKVFDWDGASLAELDKADHEGLEFQVRSSENTYEGARSPFQISWIDVYDADPVYTLRKLDAAEVKDLDKQFSNLGASAKTAASAKKKSTAHPARVPADDGDTKKGPTAPKKQVTTPPKSAADMSPAEKKAALKKKSDRIKQEAARKKQEAAAKKAAPKAPEKTTPPPPPEDGDDALPLPEAEGEMTKAEAWGAIFEMRDETIDDATVKELWDAAIEEVTGGGVAHKDITGKQWYQVKEIVLKDCGKF
jgi:hypothetical protein